MSGEVQAFSDLQEEVPKGDDVLIENGAAEVLKVKEFMKTDVHEEDINEAAKVSRGKEVLHEVLEKEIICVSEGYKEANASSYIPERVVLKSSDAQEFELLSSLAMQSGTIKHLIEDGVFGNSVPLPNVTGSVLSKIIGYWNARATLPSGSDRLKNFEKEFVRMEQSEIFEVIMAANYLDIKSLLDLTSQAVADTIKDMSVEEVRDYFGIENDFSPEEEARIRDENSWAFD